MVLSKPRSADTNFSSVGWQMWFLDVYNTLISLLSRPYIKTEAAQTLSGTLCSWLAVPAGVSRVTITLSGVSTNGTSPVILQLGDTGGWVTTGYTGGVTRTVGAALNGANYTNASGIYLDDASAATYVRHGQISLIRNGLASNVWVASFVLGDSGFGGAEYGGASITVPSELTQIRLSTVGGVDTFDAGSASVLYE
jgi:hypothetical protein